MKIPHEIRIAGLDYNVRVCGYLNDGERVLRGNINYHHSEINILDELEHQQKCATLIHEILHGIFYHYSIEMEENKEEEVVEKLAHGLYQVLQDNGGKLFDLMKEE